jgi:hypothetical protein
MIVSGGKILAIDGVEHDLTLSGDGVKTPIGITEELLEKIRDVSGKLDTTDFETWSAQTEHWDVQEYSGGEGIKVENHNISVSAKYLTSGDLEPYATKDWVEDQKYITSAFLEPYAKTEWVQSELEKKQDASAMSAYAQSAWVDENFQPKGDYITPDELEAALEPYATSAWVNGELGKKVDVSAMSAYATSAWVDQNFLKEADYHEYSAGNDYIRIDEYKVYGYDWTSAVSAVPFKLDTSSFEQYSGWADRTYLKEDALEPYATSAWALDTFFKTSEYFYAVSGTDSSSEYFNWSVDTLSASWKVKQFNLSFDYAVKPVSACPDFIYSSRMLVGNTTIDDRHYIEGYSDTVNYNVSYNIYNADNKTYKFTFSADDKLSLENLQISCIGFINPRTLSGYFSYVEDGTSGNFVDSDGNKFIFVEKFPVG